MLVGVLTCQAPRHTGSGHGRDRPEEKGIVPPIPPHFNQRRPTYLRTYVCTYTCTSTESPKFHWANVRQGRVEATINCSRAYSASFLAYNTHTLLQKIRRIKAKELSATCRPCSFYFSLLAIGYPVPIKPRTLLTPVFASSVLPTSLVEIT